MADIDFIYRKLKCSFTTRKPVLTYINYARSGPNTILSDVRAWKFHSHIPFTHTAKITTNMRIMEKYIDW